MKNKYRGVSIFAIMNRHYPYARALDIIADVDRPFLPVLYRHFGLNWQGIMEFLWRYGDRPHLLEFHLCFRYPNQQIVQDARKIQKKMSRLSTPSTKVVICPILEDVCSNKQWRLWAKKVRAVVDYPLVRSSLNQGSTGGFYQEVHGKNPLFSKVPKRRIANPDGCTIDFGDNERYLYAEPNRKQFVMSTFEARSYVSKQKKNFAFALWSARMQGLDNTATWSDGGNPKTRFKGKKAKEIITPQCFNGMKKLLRG